MIRARLSEGGLSRRPAARTDGRHCDRTRPQRSAGQAQGCDVMRAIITPADVEALRARAPAATPPERSPATGPDDAVGAGVEAGTARSANAGPTADTWYERLLKYIPAESVALYLALEGIVRTPTLPERALQVWLAVVLAVCLLFTWLYLRRASEVAPTTTQLLVSSGALVVYVFALGGFFATLGFWEPWQGTLLLVVSTAFLTLYVPPPVTTRER